MPAYAAHQKYVRTEGTAVLRKLPQEARDSLRYFEVVACIQNFHSLAPLPQGVSLHANTFYVVCVTDYCLFILSMDSKMDGSVLLELPFLVVRELVSRVV